MATAPYYISGPRYGPTAYGTSTPTGAAPPPPPPPPKPPAAPVDFAAILGASPGVIAAKYYETQGLADLASEPMPYYNSSGGSTAQYDLALKHLQEDKPIQLGRLDYALGLNKGNLEHQHAINAKQIVNNLAARNMLRSGAKGSMQHEEARAFDQQMTDLTTRDSWARQDIDRNIQHSTEQITAARAAAAQAANQAYSQAMAERARGMNISKRNLHNAVIDAYIDAYKEYISNPAEYLGVDPNFDPRKFLGGL